MNELPPFNPSRRPHKSDPGLGDDVPCIKCCSPLDTGLECTECSYDNWEAVYGEPRLERSQGIEP